MKSGIVRVEKNIARAGFYRQFLVGGNSSSIQTYGGIDTAGISSGIASQAIPELSTALFGGLGLLALLRRRR